MSTSKKNKLCSECQSIDVSVVCAIVECKREFCGNCAGIDTNESTLDKWVCQRCAGFLKSERTLRSAAKNRPEQALAPRQLKFDNSKVSKKEHTRLQMKNDADDENKKLKEELQETKRQLELMQLKIQKHDGQFHDGDERLSETPKRSTAQFNVNARQFVMEQTDDATVIEPTKDDPAANIVKYLADAIRMLQPNVPVNTVHNGNDHDEQLKLTMIRASLPDLPTFSGAFEEWPLFERIYQITTETGRYTEELNHLRLIKCLDGKAKVECRLLLNGMAGGTAIMSHLKSVYGDPEKILSRQVKRLLKMRAPKDLEKYQLKEFVSELESFVINAESLGRADFLCQPSIIDQLVFKLRDRHRDAWGAMKLVNQNVNLKDLWKYLAERLKDASAQPPTESYEYRAGDSRRMHTHREERFECLKCKSSSHDLQHCGDFKNLMFADKKNFLRSRGLCNCCLKQGHRWKDCKTKRMCNIDNCREYHHRVLHFKSHSSDVNREAEKEFKHSEPRIRDGSSSQSNPAEPERSNYHRSSSVLYKILPVVLHGNNGELIETYAFLDDGSSVTLLDRELYDKLNVKGVHRPLNLRWTSGICREESESYIFDCQVSRGERGKKFPLYGVRTVEQLDLAPQTVVASELQERFKHLRGVPLPSFENAQPKLLIGLKNVSFLTSMSCINGADDEPVAIKTKLGWTVFGTSNDALDNCAVHKIFDEERLMSIRCNETYVATTKNEPMPVDDLKVMQVNEDIELPDNEPMAMRRLIDLEKSLERTTELRSWSIEKFDKLQAKGYMRTMNERNVPIEWKRTWLLPTVINDNKISMRARQVYDAAVKYRKEFPDAVDDSSLRELATHETVATKRVMRLPRGWRNGASGIMMVLNKLYRSAQRYTKVFIKRWTDS
ncbi:uncharacterized protein [Chironomus tepperi]|uniref:uncharacterized protein n=1 Tax=Chironomus tepperi TaxID=113505 RepID=UPI00391FBFDD